MSLGEIIRSKREELGLTLDEVGSRIGFSKPYLSTIETGKVSNPPSDELLQKLEKVIGFEPGTILYPAHMERMPADIRERVETVEAENEKLRQLNKDPKKKDDIADKPSLSPGRLVPIINKVAAGYPTDFNDLDYPSVSRMITFAVRMFMTPMRSRCGLWVIQWSRNSKRVTS